MKKLKTLLVPLMACSFLASCGGGGGNAPETLTFSVTDSSVMCKDKKAIVHLDWTPSDHSLEFTKFSFTYSGITVDKVAQTGDLTTRPAEVTITFEEELTTSITGTLNFHYTDKTAKSEGDGKVEGINVGLVPPTPVVDEGGIDLTYMRMNAAKGAQVKFSYTSDSINDDIKVYWGDGTVDNSNYHRYNSPGKYHIYITGHVNNIALNDSEGKALAPDNCYITNIVFSNYVTTIASNAFKAAKVSTLQSVLISKKVSSIGKDAFTTKKAKIYCFEDKRGDGWDSDCFNGVTPTNVTFGLNLYMKEDNILYAAYNNEGGEKFATVYICCDLELKDANIKDEIKINEEFYPVTAIWDSAFYNMDTLESVTISSNVTMIDGYAFVNCKNLKTITFNDKLETIGSSAFRNTAITSLALPATIETLGSNAFSDCKQLTSVKFLVDDTTKESNFTTLDSNIFANCSNINKFELAEGLTTIKAYAIESLAITELVLPSTVTALESYIIKDCTSLKSIDASRFKTAGSIPDCGEHPYAFLLANKGSTVKIKIDRDLSEDNFTDMNWPESCAAMTGVTGIEYVPAN